MSYVGHSQGTTDFFAMASEKPEFNSRIRLMIALSPILKMKNVQHRGLKWAAANIMTIRVNKINLKTIAINYLINILGGRKFARIARYIISGKAR